MCVWELDKGRGGWGKFESGIWVCVFMVVENDGIYGRGSCLCSFGFRFEFWLVLKFILR